MSSASISGNIVFPAAPGGANQSVIIGSPVITSASTTGPTLSYTEGGGKTLLVTQAAGLVTVSFDTVVSADLLYVGTDYPIDVKISGSATAIALTAGGFILIYKGAATAMTVQASTSNSATVHIVLLGS